MPCWITLLLVALAPAPADAATRPAAPAWDANDWPGDARGLVFCWHDASRQNHIPGPGGKAVPCRVTPRGRAKLYRFSDMDLAGGAFLAEGADERLLAACRASGQLTVEALITPGAASQTRQKGPAAIVSFSGPGGQRNFTLGQAGEELVLLLRTATGDANAPIPLCKLAPGKPQHVIVTVAGGVASCYLDGQRVSVSPAGRGGLGNWQAQHLLFGDEWGGGHDWDGRLEGIALYGRAVGPDEAARKHALYARRLTRRKPAGRIVLTGRLTEVTPTPTVPSIHPYRRCLAVYTYRVEKVHEGRYLDRKVLVAHWVILDGKVLDLARKVGGSYRLELEPFSDHRQLAPERRVMVQNELDLELFYDVAH